MNEINRDREKVNVGGIEEKREREGVRENVRNRERGSCKGDQSTTTAAAAVMV